MQNKLYFRTQKQWKPLPTWGQFFIELGYMLGARESLENRIVVGLALPTKAYAASLIATGVIAGRLSHPSPNDENFRRLQKLATLDIGTQFYYRRPNGELKKVCFDGLTADGAMIQLHDKDTRYQIPPKLIWQIEVPEQEFTSLSSSTKSYSNTSSLPFLSCLLNAKQVEELTLHSRLDCVIISSIWRIEQEVNHVRFATKDNKDDFHEGVLQDILRVRRFSASGDTYRSDIFYTHLKKELSLHPFEIPTIVIFDGAKSYLQWEATGYHSNCAVLLDQTEPDFEAAVQSFNENFVKRRLDKKIAIKFTQVLPGVPISIYQEKKN